MSGRVRTVLADGRVVQGYRKTLRRNPRRSPIERVHDLNARRAQRIVTGWKVRLGFLLPKEYQAFLSSGPHGSGVDVLRGFVHVSHDSAGQCFGRARAFLDEIVGRDRPAFAEVASVISLDHPDERYTRYLCFASGKLFVFGASIAPQVYE